jgi:hypothetical protein
MTDHPTRQDTHTALADTSAAPTARAPGGETVELIMRTLANRTPRTDTFAPMDCGCWTRALTLAGVQVPIDDIHTVCTCLAVPAQSRCPCLACAALVLSPVASPATTPPPGPILALDVDGVLNVEHQGVPFPYTGTGQAVAGTVYLDPGHGRWLSELIDAGIHLVWATSWRAMATTWIAPRLGLPLTLPWLDVGPFTDPRFGHSPKLAAVTRYSADRPLVWIDDQFGGKDGMWAADRADAGTPTLLLDLGHRPGLQRRDIDTVLRWLRSCE